MQKQTNVDKEISTNEEANIIQSKDEDSIGNKYIADAPAEIIGQINSDKFLVIQDAAQHSQSPH